MEIAFNPLFTVVAGLALIVAIFLAFYAVLFIFFWWRLKRLPACPNCGGTGVPLSDAAVERCSLCVIEVSV